jgi:hypothetical protein
MVHLNSRETKKTGAPDMFAGEIPPGVAISHHLIQEARPFKIL